MEFTAAGARDFRLAHQQATTDRGDPADDVGDEPEPNGQRINLGAFGGTAEAERTAAALIGAEPLGSPLASPDGWGTVAASVSEAPSGGGCAVSGQTPTWSPFGLLVVPCW